MGTSIECTCTPLLQASKVRIELIIRVISRGGTVSALFWVVWRLSDVCDMRTMKMLKALLLPFVAMAASMVTPAQAIPIDYAVQYSGTVGSSFTGSFTWDADTSIFTDFIWNLSATPDTLMANNWAAGFLGGTTGRYLFEILTSQDLHPSACSSGSRCTFNSIKVSSSLVNSVEFRTLGAGVTDYFFRSGSDLLYSGTLVVSRVALLVSEPVTLLLMGAGLLGLAVRRRKSN